jgi:hypothetical protein
MLRSQEFYVQKQVQEFGGLPAIDEAIELIQEYAEPSYCYYKSKNLRLAEWNPAREDIYEIVLAVFTITLSNSTLTYQCMVGMLASRFDIEDHIDAVKTAAEVTAIISKTGLINIERSGSGNYIMISTKYGLDEELPEPERHAILMKNPPIMVSNRHLEHGGSLILGGSQNHHDGDICLDHLNRMNGIKLKLNRQFLRKYEEAPTFALDSKEKREQWEDFITNSYRAYIKLVRAGNRFYLEHNYDKRGRTYAEGYHISTQGSSFKRSIVQLADAELVEG